MAVKIGYCKSLSDCKSLQCITLPTTIVDIGSSTFRNCNKLKEVVLNEGLEKIGEEAFSDCISLATVSFPSTLNTVGKMTFIRCKSLKRITLPNISKRLESIVQAGHVEVASQIDSITLPGSVKRHGSEMFLAASAIQSIGGDNRGRKKWDKTIKALLRCLARIKQLIVYYEMKEATTILFELAVWKAMIDQAGDSVNRDACRVGVPKLVKDSILQYLIEHQDKAKRT